MKFLSELTNDQIEELRKETRPETLRSYMREHFSDSSLYIIGSRESGERFGEVVGTFFREQIARQILTNLYPGRIPAPFHEGLLLCEPEQLASIIENDSPNIPNSTRQDWISVRTPKQLEDGTVFDSPFDRGVNVETVKEVYRFLNTHLHTTGGRWKPY